MDEQKDQGLVDVLTRALGNILPAEIIDHILIGYSFGLEKRGSIVFEDSLLENYLQNCGIVCTKGKVYFCTEREQHSDHCVHNKVIVHQCVLDKKTYDCNMVNNFSWFTSFGIVKYDGEKILMWWMSNIYDEYDGSYLIDACDKNSIVAYIRYAPGNFNDFVISISSCAQFVIFRASEQNRIIRCKMYYLRDESKSNNENEIGNYIQLYKDESYISFLIFERQNRFAIVTNKRYIFGSSFFSAAPFLFELKQKRRKEEPFQQSHSFELDKKKQQVIGVCANSRYVFILFDGDMFIYLKVYDSQRFLRLVPPVLEKDIDSILIETIKIKEYSIYEVYTRTGGKLERYMMAADENNLVIRERTLMHFYKVL